LQSIRRVYNIQQPCEGLSVRMTEDMGSNLAKSSSTEDSSRM